MHTNGRFRQMIAGVIRQRINAAHKGGCVALSCAVLSLLFSAAVLQAQVNTGSLSGLVLDPSGAALAGTELTVTSAETGYSRTGKSLADGAYSLPDLPIGNYSLTRNGEWFFAS